MAKKAKRKGSRVARNITAREIFDMWTDSAKGGLGSGKKFSKDIFDEVHTASHQKG